MLESFKKQTHIENLDEFEDSNYLEEKNEIGEDEEIDAFDILSNKIISFIGNYSLKQYFENMSNKIFIKPEFQRNSVWNRKMESKLIESFLASYPVPPLFLYLQADGKYLIIDGFQRLNTIEKYYNNEFSLLVNNNKFRNKKYIDLPEEAKRKLDNTFLNCYIIQDAQPDDKTFLFNLFERLNTGGKRLNSMETRRAISYGKLIVFLESLNKNNDWRLILNKPKPDNRFLDLELLLRLYALSQTYNINSPDEEKLSFFKINNNLNKTDRVKYDTMKNYLNKFVEDKTDIIDIEFKDKFEKCCRFVVNELGENPFIYKKSRTYNYTILDSVMTSLLILGDSVDSKFKSNFENFKNYTVSGNEEKTTSFYFDNKSGTLSRQRVLERINLAIEFFKEAVL